MPSVMRSVSVRLSDVISAPGFMVWISWSLAVKLSIFASCSNILIAFAAPELQLMIGLIDLVMSNCWSVYSVCSTLNLAVCCRFCSRLEICCANPRSSISDFCVFCKIDSFMICSANRSCLRLCATCASWYVHSYLNCELSACSNDLNFFWSSQYWFASCLYVLESS